MVQANPPTIRTFCFHTAAFHVILKVILNSFERPIMVIRHYEVHPMLNSASKYRDIYIERLEEGRKYTNQVAVLWKGEHRGIW